MTGNELLDPVAAGAYLGGTKPLARQTLSLYRQAGSGPVYCKVGRLVRYRRADLDAWMAARMRSSTSETVN